MSPVKPKSGAQKKRERKQRAELECQQEAARQASAAGQPSVASFAAQLGIKPPPDDPLALVVWVNGVAGKLCWVALSDEHLTLDQRLRWASDFIAKAAMTHAKALVDERLAALERRQQLDDEEAADEDLDSIQPAAERPPKE
jgi:hypothetical protein